MSRPVKVEVVFAPLQSCLVNLPPSLIALISNTNTSVQNVIVEFQYRSQTLSSGAVSSGNAAGFQRSAYAGWTGMPSKSRPTSVLSNERSRGSKDADVSTVEIDPTFARAVGLSEGQITGLMLHLDPPLAHSINIEPATPSDWELIELHANFLEINFLAQIRALPNPSYTRKDSTQTELNHPLTLYLTPTSTATILITSLTPPKAASQPFAKIASDAEVIVAPKTRQKSAKHVRNDTRSIGSRRSRQSITSVRTSGKKAARQRDAVFLRGVDYNIAKEFLGGANEENGLVVWLSQSTITSEALGGSVFVRVSVIRPAGLREQPDDATVQKLKEEEASNAGRPAQRLVARVATWRKPTDDRHAVLSPMLATLLGIPSFSGLLLRVDAAPSPIARSALKSFTFHPFTTENHKKSDGLKFGGESHSAKQALSDRLRITHGGNDGLLSGPLTDGMIIPPSTRTLSMTTFDGGILRFNVSRDQEADGEGMWCIGGEQRQDYDVKDVVPRPVELTTLFPTFKHDLPPEEPRLIGVDDQIKKSLNNLTLCSSILLTGGIGAGKTAVAAHIGRELRESYLFNVNYFSCQKLVNDETRVSTIKETLQRYFASASWCSRLGGQSVVILDDLDKICPVETELQVGNDNGRSRQVTEILCSIVRQFCSINSGVTLLATASSKDALHNILIGVHIFSEIISLKAPSKDVRNQILIHLTTSSTMQDPSAAPNGHTRNSNSTSETSWMNPSRPTSSHSTSQAAQIEGFHVSPNLDLLDVAGRTDGYMPADLSLLVSRARNEALIRTISTPTTSSSTQALTLASTDFTAALKNFTPTSLRNVTLTHSTTTFASIGGLSSTRATLLETLQYPTKYAPIFARSPLRLRSGLLLYGYPGCGKTLLASAVAGECNLNFISVKGPEILNKYIGASEKSVRDLFERAQAAKPCVLFFDEFDSIAPKRGHDSTGVTDRVVNQMLTQMDGAEGLEGVYVLAATSRPDLIDPALLRPGRLDKSLLCDMPDLKDREDILRAVSVKLHLLPEAHDRLGEVARRTEGFSGADLQALMYNAHLEAIHDLLGDNNATKAKPNGETSQDRRNSKGRRGKEDFIQFLYDPEADAAARKSITSHAFDAQSVIVKKLEDLKIARKREKAALRGQRFDPGTATSKDEAEEKEGGDEKVSINWAHILKSLAGTRSSISAQEKRRLEAIYREFVQGRDGEVKSGEGNRDIGGRTSLM